MKTFREYLQEAELMETNPAVGDIFELEIAREEIVLESYIVDVVEDGIVIEADETMMRILTHVGYLTENSNMPPAADANLSPIHSGQDARKFNKEHSPDNDLEEEMSQQAQDAFKDLDATISGSKPAGAAGLDKDLEDFSRRARSGELGPSTPRSKLKPVDQYEMDIKFGNVPPGTNYGDWLKSQPKPTNEAKYQGREVPLGKPMKGDVKKSKVYVKNAKGNVVKVNFGDPNMKIKKSNPKRRKSFRARHNCANPGPRTSARYWSCRAW
jgi:hypothetical protein